MNNSVYALADTTAPATTMGSMVSGVWREVRAHLRREYGDTVFAAEIARLRVVEDLNQRILIVSPNEFSRSWVEDNLGSRLAALWAQYDQTPREIELCVDGQALPVSSDLSAETRQGAAHRASGANVGVQGAPSVQDSSTMNPEPQQKSSRFTFDTFMVGQANVMAATAAKAIATSPEPPFNPVFFHGDYGVGKTHLMSAIVSSCAPAKKCMYLTAEEFLNGFRSALRQNNVQPFKDQVRTCDVLLIDDVHFIAGKPRTEDEFLHTLLAMIAENKQVVLASHCTPSELNITDERLRSVLRGGFACPLQSPDLDLRRKIVDCKITQARTHHCPDLDVPEAVRDFLAARVTSSPRDLEGVLNNVIVRTAYMGLPVTMDTVEDVLRELPVKTERRLTVDDIQKACAAHFSISVSDLTSKRRTQTVVRPRHIAMYLAKTLTTRSLPDIGRRFGGRDHSTVIHAVNKISERLPHDPTLMDDIEAVKRQLQN
nr:chromosomal replication initiator protein DnaA [Woodsholea maritima]